MTLLFKQFSRASIPSAFLCLFFRYERYLDLAVSHNMAINLEASDHRKAFDEGLFPIAGWEDEARASADAHAKDLKHGIKSALKMTLLFSAAGLLMAVTLGKVHPMLAADWGKILSIVGGLLAAWATLFELGGYASSHNGEALHEKMRPVFFRTIFLPGLVVVTTGQLWWQ